MTVELASLGGTPAFERTFSIIRPSADEFATPQLLDRISEVLQSNMLSNVGIYVRQFEEACEKTLQVDHVVAVSSCTAGLILTLHALGLRGRRIAIPSFTFSATALACFWNDSPIRYLDVDETLTVDPELVGKLEREVRGLVPVHMYGNPCDIEALDEWGERTEVPIVYDAAHALGSTWREKPVGGFGVAEVFSLSPTKLITSGEGGCIATNDARLDDTLRILRNYGNLPDYTCDTPGLNARMSEINAVLGLEMLGQLNRYVESRNQYVARYRSRLASVPGIAFQHIREAGRSSHKDFSLLVSPDEFGMNRDELARALAEENIATKKYFYPPLHRLAAFQPKTNPSLPVTDLVSYRVLSLPIHNVMRMGDVDEIAERVALIQANAPEVNRRLAA